MYFKPLPNKIDDKINDSENNSLEFIHEVINKRRPLQLEKADKFIKEMHSCILYKKDTSQLKAVYVLDSLGYAFLTKEYLNYWRNK